MGKDAKGKVVDFFSSENIHWLPSATESQKFTKDSMTDRAFLYKEYYQLLVL